MPIAAIEPCEPVSWSAGLLRRSAGGRRLDAILSLDNTT